MKIQFPLLASVFAAFLLTNQAFSTHLRSGEIIVEQTSSLSTTCKITVRVWTNTNNTSVLFGGDESWLDFGDGTSPVLVPEQNNIIIDQAAGIGYAEYSVNHTYAGPGRYKVSYKEPNRNAGILNIANSGTTPFYLETSFAIDPFFNAYATPEFLAPAIFKGGTSLGYSFSLAASDRNGYSLYYELVIPKRDNGTPITGYMTPGNLTVNPFNGLITWDGKFQDMFKVGEFLIAVKVYQIHNTGAIVGYVIRDVQIIVEDSPIVGEISDDQNTDANGRIFVGENQTREIQVSAASVGNEIKMEAFSSLGSQNYTFETVEGSDHATGVIKLTSTADIVRDSPYMITVRSKIGGLARDVNYLVYTKDIQPTPPNFVMSSEVGDRDNRIIYPNPVRDFLQIDIPNTKGATVAILNQQGVRVQLHSIAEDNSVDLRTLPSGLYICEVRQANNLIVRKKILRE